MLATHQEVISVWMLHQFLFVVLSGVWVRKRLCSTVLYKYRPFITSFVALAVSDQVREESMKRLSIISAIKLSAFKKSG